MSEDCDEPTLEEMIKRMDVVTPVEHHINATPDGKYAIRILEYYRDLCGYTWSDSSTEEPKNPLFVLMNEHQELRKSELNEAIAILRQGTCKHQLFMSTDGLICSVCGKKFDVWTKEYGDYMKELR